MHVFFALFHSPRHAEEAIHEVEALGTPDQPVVAFAHVKGPLAVAELPLSATHTREGLADGALIGAAVGAIGLSGLLTVLGLMAFGPAFVLCGALGAGFGAIAGLLAAASNPDPALERLAAQRGEDDVLVTFEVPGLTREEDAITACRRHGAEIRRKPVL